MLVVLVLTACGAATATPTASVEHQNHTYYPDITDTITTQKWKSGDEVRISWKARSAEYTNSARPIDISLQLSLYGPAATKQDAEKLIATGTPLVAAPLVQTDSWSGQDLASTFVLPARLAPGTYHLVTQIEYVDPNKGSRTQTTSTSAITVVG